jgi:wobble nucleotide-excising tRNase
MKITRIDKIKDHLIFKDFNWNQTLPDFKRFNLIYGWNGSGKTTLSNLLRCMEKRKDISTGEFSIVIDDKIITSSLFKTEISLPHIRVFNREFIEENIFTPTGDVNPIFYLGKESISKQKEIEDLKSQLTEKQKSFDRQNVLQTRAESDFDQFTKDRAKTIKELLSSSGPNLYNNYTKASFKGKAEQLLKSISDTSKSLTESQKLFYKKQKDATVKPEMQILTMPIMDIYSILSKVNVLLSKTVTSDIIATLKNDSILAEWVKNGLALHVKSNSAQCLFCGQPIPVDLLNKYKGHFNDAFNQFVSEIESMCSEIETAENELQNFTLHNKAELYDHLSSNYEQAKQKTKIEIESIRKYLPTLRAKLIEKKKSPFIEMVPILDNPPIITDTLDNINAIINKHNTETQNFKTTVIKAHKILEESLVLESLELYKQKSARITSIRAEIEKIKPEIVKLQTEIMRIEQQIIEHRSPADELNDDLANYLGHTDLKFEVLENGYRLMRHGNIASGLSEGEKTAIAFLYFLKSLNDKAFKIKDGIIVIDDPISSLDANSLFCAFGFMQAKVKEAGQLFILTHNFPFFKQVKNWYNHACKKQYGYYMIESLCYKEDRRATLLPLDPLLSDYDSEYHYLFKLVYSYANQTGTVHHLEEYYHLPNIARRLLESFLSFKHPKKAGIGLNDLLKEIQFDEAKKSKILRFLHTHSHYGNIDDPEHDISILSETPQILRDVIELIKTTDKDHHDELVELVKQQE